VLPSPAGCARRRRSKQQCWARVLDRGGLAPGEGAGCRARQQVPTRMHVWLHAALSSAQTRSLLMQPCTVTLKGSARARQVGAGGLKALAAAKAPMTMDEILEARQDSSRVTSARSAHSPAPLHQRAAFVCGVQASGSAVFVATACSWCCAQLKRLLCGRLCAS